MKIEFCIHHICWVLTFVFFAFRLYLFATSLICQEMIHDEGRGWWCAYWSNHVGTLVNNSSNFLFFFCFTRSKGVRVVRQVLLRWWLLCPPVTCHGLPLNDVLQDELTLLSFRCKLVETSINEDCVKLTSVWVPETIELGNSIGKLLLFFLGGCYAKDTGVPW